jgi:hypothetical protein
MEFVDWWVRNKKTLIPRAEIIKHMKQKYETKSFTTINSLNSLQRKGYLRRSCQITNKTLFVQLRSVD